MEKIDLSTWERREHFLSYVDSEFPYVIAGVDVDVKNIHRFAREKGVSFTYCMIYACTKVANTIPNFQLRMIDREAYRLDQSAAVTTHLQKGRDIFNMVRCDDYASMEEFARENRAKADLPITDRDPREVELANDIISFSSIPWIHYTHFIRTVNKLGKDCNPKITFGKYEWKDGKLLMPLTTQTHHGLVDGLHIGQFFMGLEEYLEQETFL